MGTLLSWHRGGRRWLAAPSHCLATCPPKSHRQSARNQISTMNLLSTSARFQRDACYCIGLLDVCRKPFHSTLMRFKHFYFIRTSVCSSSTTWEMPFVTWILITRSVTYSSAGVFAWVTLGFVQLAECGCERGPASSPLYVSRNCILEMPTSRLPRALLGRCDHAC